VGVPRVELRAPELLAVSDVLEHVLLAGGEEAMEAEGADGQLHGRSLGGMGKKDGMLE
jgi:hypothetical protein